MRKKLTRAEWRTFVLERLKQLGAIAVQSENGIWRVRRNSAYYVLVDIADISNDDLRLMVRD